MGSLFYQKGQRNNLAAHLYEFRGPANGSSPVAHVVAEDYGHALLVAQLQRVDGKDRSMTDLGEIRSLKDEHLEMLRSP